MNLFVCPRRLIPELIAGNVNDLKTLVMQLLIHPLQGLIVGRKSAAGGRIDNDHNLSLIFLQGKLASVRSGYRIIINTHNLFLSENKTGDLQLLVYFAQ